MTTSPGTPKSTIEKVETGVPGLDILTHGGVPRGRATLITGKSGTCKSILGLQIAAHQAQQGTPALVLTAEEEPEDFEITGNALDFRVSELCERQLLHIANIATPMEGPTVVLGEFDVAGLIHRIEQAARQHQIQLVVLDSTTALFNHPAPHSQLRAQFFQLVHALRRLHLTAIIISEAPNDYGPLTTLGVEDFVCDMVLVLRNVIDGERRRRSLEVHKYRRSPHYKGQYPCTMTSHGLTVFPLDAQGRERVRPTERYSSGIPGLDAMNHGGWIRDAIVLVRGPSGSGKTTLAGMYARAGALRGERVIYYGFEETKLMLLRNFDSLGMPVEEFEQAGNLRVVCRYPEATSPEDMLVDIRNGLDLFRPSLVVLDSISSVEHSTSPLGFRQFMIGLASLLREHGRSALLIETVSRIDDPAVEVPYLSTIPDVILLLDHRWQGTHRLRTIRVHKMRGSAHDMEEHVLTIVPGGLQVAPLHRE